MEDVFSICTLSPRYQCNLSALYGLPQCLSERCRNGWHTSTLQSASSYPLKWRKHMTLSESRMCGITAVVEVFFGQSTFHWKTKTFKKWTCGKERVLTVLPIQESLIGTKFRDLKYSILIFWKEHLFWNDFCFTCFNIYRRVHYLLKRSK